METRQNRCARAGIQYAAPIQHIDFPPKAVFHPLVEANRAQAACHPSADCVAFFTRLELFSVFRSLKFTVNFFHPNFFVIPPPPPPFFFRMRAPGEKHHFFTFRCLCPLVCFPPVFLSTSHYFFETTKTHVGRDSRVSSNVPGGFCHRGNEVIYCLTQ